MDEYPFNLRGKQERFSGLGHKDGETTKSKEFDLSQGLVIAKIEHHGYGDFNLKFVPTGGSTASTTGAAAGAAAGAAIGSVIPVLGTIIGGVVGAGIGVAISDSMAGWKLGDYTGQFSTWALKQIKEGGEDCLPPGKYRLEVESKDRWSCDFIQLALGQSFGSFDDNGNNGDAGIYFWGPQMSSTQLLLATIRHNGAEDFFCVAYSVDGTHHWVFQEEGQFHIAKHQTEIKPGKEYIIYVWAGDAWTLTFEEAIQGHNSQTLDEEDKAKAVLRTMFLMFGKIAQTDLLVSNDEISAIEAFMVELEFDHETRKMAFESFNEGKTTEVPFKEITAEFAQYIEDIAFRSYILYCLVRIAAADGVLHASEEQYLNDAVTAFGLPLDSVSQALEEILPIEKYYAILGCDPSVSDDELKRRYRELSLQYHPDRISSKDLAPDFIKLANEKFQEIQNAYEVITEHRK